MKLIRLGNGDWVDPREIQGIRPLVAGIDSNEEVQPPRLIVCCGGFSQSIIELGMEEDPQKAADALAESVNAAMEAK